MNLDKNTKIIATLGPSSDKKKEIKDLILNGVNVFRFNLKHNEIEWHNKRIKRVQQVANQLKTNIGILIDLQGPEIRIDTKNKESISVKKGDEVIIGDSFFSEKIQIALLNKAVFDAVDKNTVLLIDDGFIELKVLEKRKNMIVTEVVQGGKIENKKSLNIPGKNINVASLIDQDIKRLDMLAKEKVDFIALSFVRSEKDINVLKKEVEKRKIKAQIISKVECEQALKNIDSIIENSDGVMIARGDLGIETPIEELAFWQKNIIQKCRVARKPVIIATQMLHSMVLNPRPTRAEALDVANAVFDKTDAVMLSEETATGNYPVKTVQSMSKILDFNEKKDTFKDFQTNPYNIIELLSSSIISLIEKKSTSKIKKIIVFTESGYTAHVLASFRSKAEIIAVSNKKKTVEILSLAFGINAFYFPESYSRKKIFSIFKQKQILKDKEKIIFIHGKQTKTPNVINCFSLIKINNT